GHGSNHKISDEGVYSAIKCIDRSRLSKLGVENLICEIQLLKKLNHPNIVKMEDFLWDQKNIYIVMEYCGGGDLSKLIQRQKRLSEQVCRRYLHQLAKALKYLRENDICHLDLKPGNILLSSSLKTLKLADFGFAQHLSEEDKETALKGSPLYMAPEILLGRSYDARVDLWSVGVILYECLFGKAPFSSSTLDEILRKIRDPRAKIVIPDDKNVSPECTDLLKGLLRRDPDDRLDFQAFFGHPFVDVTSDPLEKGRALLTDAVEADADGRYPEALQAYSKGLPCLLSALHCEEDPLKASHLREKIAAYISRAETLKAKLSSINNSCCQDVKLSWSTPGLKSGLELGLTGEAYDMGGEMGIALETYTRALGILLPLLPAEPQSPRRDLLSSQASKTGNFHVGVEFRELEFDLETLGKILVDLEFHAQVHGPRVLDRVGAQSPLNEQDRRVRSSWGSPWNSLSSRVKC
ncbi:unnamed protein product, partial [Darwinula stevensoni]